MHGTIDTKSGLIGGLLVALILCVVGAVSFAQPGEYGRFHIETNDSHAFILDSATGQVWSSIFLGNLFGPDPNFHAIKALPLPRSF